MKINKESIIKVRITELEKVVYKNIAESEGITMSELVMSALHMYEQNYYKKCQRQKGNDDSIE